MDERLVRAFEASERAVFDGDEEAVALGHSELDGVEADLALARGRLMHARFLSDREEYPIEPFERAAALYQQVGDVPKQADALFRVGLYHQVVRGDHEAALPHLERSRELALSIGDQLTLSYVVRHLGFAEMEAKRWDAARELFDESVALRREIDFQPGIAAGLLALAYLAHESGDRAAEMAFLDEGLTVATACGAKGIANRIMAAQQEIAQ